jgi:putative ubiquitin-RnfH superfamily antitoxin RatB of RatAB toxin-antitoxin module
MKVELVYIDTDEEFIVSLDMAAATATVADAVEQSQVLDKFPSLKAVDYQLGIYSQEVSAETRLQAGDRVEVYRPLVLDPMEVRRQRAKVSRT